MASRRFYSFNPDSRSRRELRDHQPSNAVPLRRSTVSPESQRVRGSSSSKRRSWAQAALVVCYHRMRLGRPRSLRQITGLLLVGPLVIVAYLLLFSNSYETILTWPARGASSAGPEDLRIVVFGSQDTWGSAPDAARTRTTWPEHLCGLLKCSSLISLVPPSESQPGLTYNAAYNKSLSAIQEQNRYANIIDVPASDLFYIVDHYPVPRTPDLLAQVDQFLSMHATRDVPRSTLWVFSFGAWDIWNLAALPREMSEPIIDASVSLLFEQIELLYRKSLKPGSIAWSDFWAHVQTKEDLEYLTNPPEGKALDLTRVEGFRVLIPELFDITLTPGWKKRPAPSMPYTRSMEMRNAVRLTNRWNDLVSNRLEDWRRKGNDKPDKIEEEGIAMAEGKPPSSTSTSSISTSSISSISSTSTSTSSNSLSKRAQEEKSGLDAKGRRIIYAPYPFRIGLHATFVSSLVSVLTEQDLQQAGLKDGRGQGTLSRKDPMRFLDTRTPCVAGGGTYNALTKKYASEECKRPNDHLFYDDFTLGQRGSKLVARKAVEYMHDAKVI